jgi:hypothetical protein
MCIWCTQRKVLGCLVSVKGIGANLNKIKAIMDMKPPQSRKVVQRLTSRHVASLIPLNGSWGSLFMPPLVAEDGATRALAVEAFSAALRPEDRASVPFTENFLQGFRGFTKTRSISDVLSLAQVKGLLHFTLVVFPWTASASKAVVTFSFFDPLAVGSDWGRYFMPATSKIHRRLRHSYHF